MSGLGWPAVHRSQRKSTDLRSANIEGAKRLWRHQFLLIVGNGGANDAVTYRRIKRFINSIQEITVDKIVQHQLGARITKAKLEGLNRSIVRSAQHACRDVYRRTLFDRNHGRPVFFGDGSSRRNWYQVQDGSRRCCWNNIDDQVTEVADVN